MVEALAALPQNLPKRLDELRIRGKMGVGINGVYFYTKQITRDLKRYSHSPPSGNHSFNSHRTSGVSIQIAPGRPVSLTVGRINVI